MDKDNSIVKLEDFFDFNSQEPINRLAYTEADLEYKVKVIKKMQELGMQITMDKAGNICGSIAVGKNPIKTIAIGSHTDSVYDGGQYDGPVGVIVGLQTAEEIINSKNCNGIIKVVIYACEESTRFGNACVGSKFLNGNLSEEDFEKIFDKRTIKKPEDITLKNAIEYIKEYLRNNIQGIDKISEEDFEKIILQKARERFKPITLKSAIEYAKEYLKNNIQDIQEVDKIFEKIDYSLEAHIEQYQILQKKCKKTGLDTIGIIDSVGSAVRVKYEVKGKANHTGSTPMSKRKNAVDATSFIGKKIRKLGKKWEKEGLGRASQVEVNTIGHNGSFNQIPDKAEGLIDFRLLGENSPEYTLKQFDEIVKQVEEKTKTNIEYEVVSKGNPAITSESLNLDIATICKGLNIDCYEMPSYPGQDTGYIPADKKTMIFIPSKGGSHNPKEFTMQRNVEVAKRVFSNLVKQLLKEKIKDTYKVNVDSKIYEQDKEDKKNEKQSKKAKMEGR